MKTTLGFLTEEGHTRARNTAQRIRLFAVLMLLVAGAGGYAIHKYWVRAKLTPLQRVYFQQYWSSSYKLPAEFEIPLHPAHRHRAPSSCDQGGSING